MPKIISINGGDPIQPSQLGLARAPRTKEGDMMSSRMTGNEKKDLEDLREHFMDFLVGRR